MPASRPGRARSHRPARTGSRTRASRSGRGTRAVVEVLDARRHAEERRLLATRDALVGAASLAERARLRDLDERAELGVVVADRGEALADQLHRRQLSRRRNRAASSSAESVASIIRGR